MLKSTISNNSPGHSHNEHTFEVGLSSDICPGNISKRKNKMKEQMIKAMLWMTCFVCLYNILTTFDGLVFTISGLVGLFSTWFLLKWDELAE